MVCPPPGRCPIKHIECSNTGIFLETLYEDESIIVVNKPAGLMVHRSHESRDKVFLLQTIRDQLGGKHLYPVHRLDRPTTGPVLLVKSKQYLEPMMQQFAERKVHKKYLALVKGKLNGAQYLCKPLKHESGKRQSAATKVMPCLYYVEQHCTLVACELITGRRHQIRRHLSSIAHQVIGDSTHGKGRINQLFRDKYSLNRLFLHCCQIKFRHPVSERSLIISCPLPIDLRSVLRQLAASKPIANNFLPL